MVVKPNWHKFKAKFNDNPEYYFEYFCYLLFCLEFDKPQGVFRYKNQAGIEWNPIKVDGKVIVAQCKFYDNSLGTYKKDLLKMLDTIDNRYPKANELKFYTNQDWGQGKEKDTNESKPKIEIEERAKEYGITIDWRTNETYFLSPDVALDQEVVRHFFTDESIYDLVYDKQQHTERILDNIHTEIKFNSQTIELDRSKNIEELKSEILIKQALILTGVGGVGKTAIIKKLYEREKEKDETPFYIFKASEFNLPLIDNLFGKYSLRKFIDIHGRYEEKIIVIDSSEKLLDIGNLDPFNEFLSALIQNKWKIIFTTRDNYLEDLQYHFIDLGINVPTLHIKNLTQKELSLISNNHNFILSEDRKLNDLLENPFYLNEYLRFYDKDEGLNYQKFKEKLWNNNIKKSKPKREKCFLDLAFKRANKGRFYINIDCSSNSLDALLEDGILGHERTGYFIAHDIYEEWALEKIIDEKFNNRKNNLKFFKKVGSSLPIRRSFRNWVSEKLLFDSDDIKSFIEEIIDDNKIELFWKDEVFVSVLLSDYSDTFFETFESELLVNDYELLKRISFLLRLACKEADNSIFGQYGLNINVIDIFSLMNQPKGNGWQSFISFVHKHIDDIKLKNINTILSVLYDWNLKNKKGKTTRLASLVALDYYEWINQKQYRYSYDEHIQKICNVIIDGTIEIQKELELILDEVIKNKWKDNRDNYYELSVMILSTAEGLPRAFPILKNMPKYVFKLANFFWTHTPKESQRGGFEREEVETAFGLEKHGVPRYYPDSALQTPFYYQLKLYQNDTIDFVIDFINKCVEKYSESGWEEVIELKVYIDDKMTIKQYHSQALWNMYRGTSSPVMPDILKSLHMALEKHILEVIKNLKQEDIETLLKYLLIKSKSSSITAIVASAILAHPDKTFNIAKILFKIKEFIQADLVRQIKDYTEVKFLYGMGYGLNNSTKVYADERLKTCEDKHRKSHLESLFLNYQMFRSEEISEDEANNRQKELWNILDNYYEQLLPKDEQVEMDKTWQMFLARMDKRKMDIQVKEVEKGFEIEFKGQLTPELEEYSKTSQKENSELMKYTSLTLWSKNRLKNNQDYKKYKEFEETPLLALDQLKELVDTKPEEGGPILQKQIFSDTSIVLLRDFSDILEIEDKKLCKDIILEFASMPFQEDYNYQISDGTDSAISNLPLLTLDFPDSKDDIKLLLILNLFRDYEIGMSGKNVHDNSIEAIVNFFEDSEIEIFLLSYLYLIPKYENTYKELREDNWNITELDVLEKFIEDYEEDIERFIINKVRIEHLEDISNIEIRKLIVATKIISRTKGFESSENIDNVLLHIIQLFSKKIYNDERDNDFETVHKFIDVFSVIILETSKEKISNYLKPLIDNFIPTEDIAWLFTQMILLQDKINNYENFWYIWSLFEDKIIETCKNNRYWDTKKVIYAYMLVWSPYSAIWKKDAKDWHSLKEKDKRFFARISKELGHNPSVLYAISFLLNSIGSNYLNDGIKWISSMIKHNDNLIETELETNTIYYLEQLSRRYILKNTQEVKKIKSKKEEILIILNFLVEKGSSLGYMLRERIL